MAEKVCLISGAGQGIGKETLLLFLSKGYFCIGIDKDEAALQDLFEEIAAQDRDRVHLAVMDLMREEALDGRIREIISAPGAKLTLVNNIGGSRSQRKPIEDDTWDEFSETMLFNLKPLHTLTKSCVFYMKQHGYGNIVNVSSISGRKALKNVGAEYAAAKSAIIGISRHLSSELVGNGIVVNTVCPGIIGTERMVDRWKNRDSRINQQVLDTIPIGRLGTPREVADAIYFLGSDANRYMTGVILDVNGGMYCP